MLFAQYFDWLAIPGGPSIARVAPNAVRNRRHATVDTSKLSGYLLNPDHPDNGGKAHFFRTQGFSIENVSELVRALRHVAANGEIVKAVESAHGEKYVVDGHLESPSGKMLAVRTVWVIGHGQDVPRFVTAYPVGR